jgi:hypothetical protein
MIPTQCKLLLITVLANVLWSFNIYSLGGSEFHEQSTSIYARLVTVLNFEMYTSLSNIFAAYCQWDSMSNFEPLARAFISTSRQCVGHRAAHVTCIM